jgi:hypothetical protein
MLSLLLSLILVLSYLSLFISPFVITAVKKRRQLGRLWPANTGSRAELSIAGKKLECTHCKQTKFQKREGILTTSWVAFFHFSCWNLSAACYTCVNCGHVEWFVRPKEEAFEFENPESLDQ